MAINPQVISRFREAYKTSNQEHRQKVKEVGKKITKQIESQFEKRLLGSVEAFASGKDPTPAFHFSIKNDFKITEHVFEGIIVDCLVSIRETSELIFCFSKSRTYEARGPTEYFISITQIDADIPE